MTPRSYSDRLLADIGDSPTPFHAVRTACDLLEQAGFSDRPGSKRRFRARSGYLVAWIEPEPDLDGEHPGYCIVGAHTDSPNLRVKVNPDYTTAGWAQLAVAVYGGALVNSWLDRDLGLAGRVVLSDGGLRAFVDREPILRVPQLAIHLDEAIAKEGLKLDPQIHLDPIWATGSETFVTYLADRVEAEPEDVVSFDVMAYDTQSPALVGKNRDLISSARLDNLLSSFAAVYALCEAADDPGGRVPVMVLYDHEEVGSLSVGGADGVALAVDLERISSDLGFDRASHLGCLSLSIVVSADGAHATHPNYADRHDPLHRIEANGGVVIKQNVNQRYATDPESEAWLRSLCANNSIPTQTYVHRNDLPCGSTIGPITAGRLGIPTVDCGVAQLAMHSVRELAGTRDLEYLVKLLVAAWRS